MIFQHGLLLSQASVLSIALLVFGGILLLYILLMMVEKFMTIRQRAFELRLLEDPLDVERLYELQEGMEELIGYYVPRGGQKNGGSGGGGADGKGKVGMEYVFCGRFLLL